MTWLIAAAVAFVVLHTGVAGSPLRGWLIARLGEWPYRAVFSTLSVAGIVWLAGAYSRAPHEALWTAPAWLRGLAVAIIAAGVALAVLGLITPSPTSVGTESRLTRSDVTRGVLRITRHPFLTGVAAWAAAHLVVNGDQASTLLFGSLLVVCVAGPASIDRKRRAAFGADWKRFADETSILPFAAIIAGRNRLAIAEIGAWRLAAAAGAVIALLILHPWLFGVPVWIG